MLTSSRVWAISSGLVGAISLIFRLLLNFSITGARFSLPTLNVNPHVIINVIIFALAASAFLFGHGGDPPVTEHHHDDETYDHEYDHQYHHHDNNHNQDDHERSSKNSSDSSFDQYKNKVQQEETKVPVRSKNGGSHGVQPPDSIPVVTFPSAPPEKTAGLRRPPAAPSKTFPQEEKSSDENETMDEMWKRVKAEKQPSLKSRNSSRMSTASCPSPSQARRPPLPQPSLSPSRTKKMERVPTWAKLKKEFSMGRDELNSRVEAFIRKFNDEMKLQRLESLRRYKLFRRGSDEK